MKRKLVLFGDIPESYKNLKGKTIVFTGGTDGMGRTAARKLVGMGAHLVILGRNEKKSLAVVDELNKISKEGSAKYIHCDLSDKRIIRKCADQILKEYSKIDILINCAGVGYNSRRLTDEGVEVTWAVNHIGPFLLSQLLLDLLKESGPARIVNLTSAGEKYGHIHFDDIELKKNWTHWKAYGQAKLAMIMCTFKLAKLLEGTDVTVNTLNPGFIKTNLLRNFKGFKLIVGGIYMKLCASPVEVGGDRIITLAISPQYKDISGKFIYEDYIKTPNPEALNNDIVERVWEITMKYAGLA